jgi:hypothetical protein
MKVDFFIIGAPKSGTTSLYHYLDEHPQVEMSTQKEPDYFSDVAIQKQGLYYGNNRIDTVEKYYSLFNVEGMNVIFGEASVSYLFYKNVASDIKKYNVNAKIIIMLRNPIDRAFSHYLMDYRLGLVSDSFEEIIYKTSVNKKAHLYYQQYIQISEYAKQIARYHKEFDADKIMLIDYEDFKKDVGKIVKSVYNFLGINEEYRSETNKKHNTFTMPKNRLIRFIYSFVFIRNILTFLFPDSLVKSIRLALFKQNKKPKLSDDTREYLKHFFKDDIMEVSQLLHKDFSKWIK